MVQIREPKLKMQFLSPKFMWIGGKQLYEKVIIIDETKLKEIAYGWKGIGLIKIQNDNNRAPGRCLQSSKVSQ